MRGQWRSVRWRVCDGGVCDGNVCDGGLCDGNVCDGGVCDSNVCDGGVIWAESSLIEDGDTAPSSYGIVHRLATAAALLLAWLALVSVSALFPRSEEVQRWQASKVAG
jgi:hypothetical protein